MRFDLRQLQAFVMLAESANYREAASRLFVTQPALTKQIQGLEQALGSTLFNRGRHGAELTAIGLQLLPQARALVDHGKGFERHALALASGAAGRLNIGFGLSSFALAPPWWPVSSSRPRRAGSPAGHHLRHPAGTLAGGSAATGLHATA